LWFAQQRYEQAAMSKQRSPTFSDAYQLFLLDCEARRFTGATLGYYRDRLGKFIKWTQAQPIQRVHELTPTHIKLYMVELQQRNLAGYSLLAAYRAIRRFCNFAVEEGWLAESPTRKTRPPQIDKDIRRLFTVGEVKKLLAACRTDREEALLLVLLDTGLRLAELVALDGEHIDIKTSIVKVRQGKQRKGRVAFLGNKARKQLLRYYLEQWGNSQGPGEGLPVWVNVQTGKRLTKSGVAQLLKRIGKRAGIKKVSPHAFRRTHATWALKAGVPVPVLQKTMGHEDLATLLRYLGLTDEDLQEAHQKYGAVDSYL
jgi:site-specific recombinase XerD